MNTVAALLVPPPAVISTILPDGATEEECHINMIRAGAALQDALVEELSEESLNAIQDLISQIQGELTNCRKLRIVGGTAVS